MKPTPLLCLDLDGTVRHGPKHDNYGGTMTRLRLRPAHPDLATIYPTPHDSTRWRDHKVRVAVTTELARGYQHEDPDSVRSVADLSCGDARIARALVPNPVLGDFAPGYQHHGPIEVTLPQIQQVDLFVCSETIEHLDDPDTVLTGIRAKSKRLVLSTPVGCWNDSNVEHYWAWSRADVEDMLGSAGFTVDAFCQLDMTRWSPYVFGIWACS